MCWSGKLDGIEAFKIYCNDEAAVPAEDIVNVVYHGSLEEYAKTLDVKSEDELYSKLMRVCNLTVIDKVFQGQKAKTFPPIYNFYCYVSSLQKKGKLVEECKAIADSVWNGTIAQRILKRNCDTMFNVEYSESLYNEVTAKMMRIWDFTDVDIEALRYFICQCKAVGDFNSSLNKSLYFWGEKKKTGKSTFARMLASCLNGDTFDNACKYESKYQTENQFNDHDLPRACVYNCVILDEAMPRDTKKSYAQLKAMITSNSVTYNPKFKQVISIKARRNYIFTSNDDIADYIQDESERRFYAINFKTEPEQIELSEIYDTIKTFVQQCKPREDISTQKWYDSFNSVDGIIRREIDMIKLQIVNKSTSIFPVSGDVTVLDIEDALFHKHDTAQWKIVKKAMLELFSDFMRTSNSAFPANKCKDHCEMLKITNNMQTYEPAPF